MRLVYPALFEPWENGTGFTVTVPDLPGCVTEGENLADAIEMAQDAASGWVLDELEDGKSIPKSSVMNDIHPEGNAFVSLLSLDMDSYAAKYGNKAVRKNLTIPAWLNTFAENQKINFSQVLTEALSAMYQQSH